MAIFLGALAAYVRTLAPTVLDGDAALFQFTPAVMGVTYPTGYPVYLFAAKIWLAIFPLGEMAWRMNLFSAVGAALAMAIFYRVAKNILRYRLAAASSVLLFATLPTFWRWATEAKIYTLNILLFATALYFLTRPKPKHAAFGALFAGLQLGVHSTTVLLLPGMLWLLWQNHRSRLKQAVFWAVAFIAPAMLYLYIPVRGEMLIAQMGRAAAIQHGLLSSFYHSGVAGWVRYFTAADFTGGVVSNWGAVPRDFFAVYLGRLMPIDWGWAGIGWGAIGLAIFWLWQPLRRWAAPLTLLFVLPIPFVLTYGRGEQNAFLLTSNLIFALFAGGVIAFLQFKIQNSKFKTGYSPWIKFGLSSLLFLLIVILPVQHARANINWLSHKWDTASRDYWLDALTHPLETDAGIMATWGDLTSMWYMQHIHHLRPEIAGLYPPTEPVAADWLTQNHPLYIAGPVLDEWSADELGHYRLIPWGRMVRLLPPDAEIPALNLPQAVNTVFDRKLALTGVDFPRKIPDGGRLTVQLGWQSLVELPKKTRYSLRLAAADGTIIAQKDDIVRPGWYPAPTIPAGLPMLGAYSLDVPVGTLPGEYRLQLTVYDRIGQEWTLPDGRRVFDLGAVTVRFAPAQGVAGWRRFGGEIALDAVEFGVNRVGQGKGYPVRFLWRALKSPAENYTLVVELVDRSGRVWRDWHIPTETASWQKNQPVHQQVDVVVPAEAPTGDGALSVRVRWLRPDGSALPARRWIFPAGDGFSLGGPQILPKENRQFNPPPVTGKLVNVNFDDKLALVGFDLPSGVPFGAKTLPLTLYWQGRGDMREVYSVFVHLVDAAGNVVAQHDGIPAKGKEPTTAWAAGEYITDPVEVPLSAELPPGEYSVVVGVYLPATGARLPITTGGDSFKLGVVSVEKE